MRDLLLRQLDRQLKELSNLKNLERPRQGWVHSIRESLGMPLRFLGKKLNVTPQTIKKLETSEASQTITLKSLHSLAEALNCRLVYALVPENSLQDMVDEKILQKARSIVLNVSHSMDLEEQKTSDNERDYAIKSTVEDLKRLKNISLIWDD